MMIVELVIFFIASIILVGFFKQYAVKKKLLDHPNHRSSHTISTPRGAGIILMVLWLIFAGFNYCYGDLNIWQLMVLLPGSFLISAVGYIDDCREVSAKLRLIMQFTAALVSLVALGWNLGWVGFILTAVVIVWSINLYNFMDGIDGIAALEALFVFCIGGFLIYHAGGHGLAVLPWGMASIITGFLVWNFPPAKIFMGDSGSALLGFLVMVFALMGMIFYKVSIFLWIIIYGVFWFDASVTLIRRILHREAWYKAHRLHAYQRLQQIEWSHGRILLGVTIINILLSGLAIWVDFYPKYLSIALVFTFIILSISYLFVEFAQPMYKDK